MAHHPTGFRRSVSQKKGRNKFARYRRARFEQEGEKEITKGDERKKSNISASRNAGDRIVRVRSYPPSHITSDLYLGRSESLTDVSTVHSVLSSEYLGSVNDIDEGWVSRFCHGLRKELRQCFSIPFVDTKILS